VEIKARAASGYDESHLGHVRATCLYVATKLGDMLDEMVIVGGIVPSLLIDQGNVREKHVGTADLDVGVTLAIFENERHQALTERLREAGFSPDTSEKGSPARRRWTIDGPPEVGVDFLVVAPGLLLAFIDCVRVTLQGKTIRGEEARREVRVSGPAAFVIMKALAFRGRGESKDAYDLVYFLQNHGAGVGDVAARLTPLLHQPGAVKAIGYLGEDFGSADAVGPRRVAEFLLGAPDEGAQADAWRAVRGLLDLLPHQGAAASTKGRVTSGRR
jgi:hypothetical protein